MLKSKETDKNVCPICGQSQLAEFDICDVCEWENDLIQFDNPDFSGGANQMSVNEARKAWAEGRKII